MLLAFSSVGPPRTVWSFILIAGKLVGAAVRTAARAAERTYIFSSVANHCYNILGGAWLSTQDPQQTLSAQPPRPEMCSPTALNLKSMKSILVRGRDGINRFIYPLQKSE